MPCPGRQGQILWRGGTEDATKLITVIDGVPWSVGGVRPNSSVNTATRREQVDANLQSSDVVAHQRGRARARRRLRKMIVEHLYF